MRTNCQRIDDKVQQNMDEGRGVKAMLAAKVFKDFFRLDSFIRQNQRRYEPFGGRRNEWGVAAPGARTAEENLTFVERRLDRLCPIRTTVATP
jgi:hypothetical protein